MQEKQPEGVPPGWSLIRKPGGGMLLIDPLMVAHLESTAPDPTQASLDELLSRVARIRILGGGVAQDRAMGTQVLLDITAPGDVAAFKAHLAIVEDPARFDHCFCLGDAAIECYTADDELLATIGYHHGILIRWSQWKQDAPLADGRALAQWVAEHGEPRLVRRIEREDRRQEEWRQDEERWKAAMPDCLRPLWTKELRSGTSSKALLDPLRSALNSAYEEEQKRIQALFHWYASGKGPWSGFPSYEGIPERLLLDYSTAQLCNALQGAENGKVLEGATRLFASYAFQKERTAGEKRLPGWLVKRIYSHYREITSEKAAGELRQQLLSGYGLRAVVVRLKQRFRAKKSKGKSTRGHHHRM